MGRPVSNQAVHGMGEHSPKTWQGEVAGEKSGRSGPELLQKGLEVHRMSLPPLWDYACPCVTKGSRWVARRGKMKLSLACK